MQSFAFNCTFESILRPWSDARFLRFPAQESRDHRVKLNLEFDLMSLTCGYAGTGPKMAAGYSPAYLGSRRR
jgi:hypothetical protein